jgi:hypothetical protein
LKYYGRTEGALVQNYKLLFIKAKSERQEASSCIVELK